MRLRQLYPQEDDLNVDKTSQVDIIAIHGLNPRSTNPKAHAWDTWRSPPGESGRLWLRDDLKNVAPRARIFLCEYDSSTISSANQTTFCDKANALLNIIDAYRDGVRDRPLILMGHSIGGILLEQALINAQANPTMKHIYNATTGLAFFGTPHNGGSARALGFKNGDSIADALDNSSMFTDIHKEHFRHQFERYQMVSFWGDKDTIVLRESSRFGLSGERERIIELDADHNGLARFGTSEQDKNNLKLVKHSLKFLYENSLEQVANIRKRNRPAIEYRPSYYLPLPRNSDFIGRRRELDELMQRLFVDKTCRKMAIVGIGGIGKTQVARQFAYDVKEKKPEYSIFWVSALSLESFEQACAKIARILKIPQALQEKGDIKELVKQQLSAREAGKWLLIVDNADDEEELFESKSVVDYLPESENGLILFTTRYQRVALELVDRNVLELHKMKEQEGVDFLEESLLRKDLICDDTTAQALLIELDYHPLAISQAAAYINMNQMPISEYLQLLKNTDDDLISLMSEEFRDNTRYRNSANAVATTWVVSFNQILKHDKIAADLLAFMSCIQWKAIPHSMLSMVQPETRLVSAIATIRSYSFAVKRDSEDVYDIHRLVHLAMKIWVYKHGHGRQTWEKAIKHLASVFPSSDCKNRETWREYLPHVVRLSKIQEGGDVAEMYRLLLKIGLCILKEGRTGEAVTWLEGSYQWRSTNMAEDHPDRLASQYALAIAYTANWQVKKAVELLETVVRIKRIKLAENHPDRLASQHALASAYTANGQVTEAVEVLEEVLRIVGTTMAEDHSDRLTSQHTPTIASGANGPAKEVKLLETVVRIRGATLAENHPDRLASQYALSNAYRANGQVKDAVELLETVVKIRGTTLAEDDPDRLASQHALAITYSANGQVKEAVEVLEEVLRIVGAMLAEDHPD